MPAAGTNRIISLRRAHPVQSRKSAPVHLGRSEAGKSWNSVIMMNLELYSLANRGAGR